MRYLRVISFVTFLVFAISISLVLTNVNVCEKNKVFYGSTKAPESFISLNTWNSAPSAGTRENTFINDNSFIRQGGGLVIDVENYDVLKRNPKPFKILMFGDSYTWNNGSENPQTNVSLRLQEELNKRTKPDTFMVVPFTANGRNTFSFVDYFANQRINEINPDLIIYNYVFNDSIPNFEESMICPTKKSCDGKYQPKLNPKYRECVNGQSNIVARLIDGVVGIINRSTADNLLTRYCEPTLKKLSGKTLDEGEISKDPRVGMYYDLWVKAVGELRKSLGDKPVYVADFETKKESLKSAPVIKKVFTDNNYKYLDLSWMRERLKFLDKGGYMEELNVNPFNSHYSFKYNENIAKNTADQLLNDLGEAKIKKLMAENPSAGPYGKPIINASIPVRLKIDYNGSDGAKFSYNPKDQIIKPVNVNFKTSQYPPQLSNCVNIGEPNVIVNLDFKETSKPFKNIEVVPNNKDIKVGYFYYDNEYNKFYAVGPSDKASLSLEPIPGAVGYSLIFYQSGRGCELTKEIGLDPFSSEIRVIR